MEIISNEFDIVINLAEERAKDSGTVFLNESSEKLDFSGIGQGFRWADRAKFDQLPSVSSVQDEGADRIIGYDQKKRIGYEDKLNGTRQVKVVNGKDIGDLPVEYRIEGLTDFEFPVKGFYVDKRIIPGFQYTVRTVGKQTWQWLFDGAPRLLRSVGMGYGKRLTFAGEKSTDPYYFWSDSNENGYAFGIYAVGEGDEFVICDDTLRPLGRAFVESILLPQQQISTSTSGGDVTMRVKVAMTVVIEYNLQRHGMMSLVGGESAVVNGVAVVVKKRHQRKAITMKIEQVVLPKVGVCTLNKDL